MVAYYVLNVETHIIDSDCIPQNVVIFIFGMTLLELSICKNKKNDFEGQNNYLNHYFNLIIRQGNKNVG